MEQKLDKLVGIQIQLLRLSKGWSQEYLAEKSSLHRTYISQLERGLKSPSIRVLFQITSALEVPTSKLIKMVEDSLNAKYRGTK